MSLGLHSRLRALGSAGQGVLAGGRRGIEKEALRVTRQGRLASTAHPLALGSALTHPHITTDFSEALLEFVTPPMPSSTEVLDFLGELHRFTCMHLDDELLWAASMPSGLSTDEAVPLAYYGSSNVGRMKTTYRRGLGHRYGRVMQTISGVHFNYSLPEASWPLLAEIEGVDENLEALRSRAYMALVRNYRRCGWLVLYLFGASPALSRSFLRNGPGELQWLDEDTAYGPWATSLRMSDVGYHNENQAQLAIPANSLDEYLEGLEHAIRTPSEHYRRIGLKDSDGGYRQLSVNLLQIENEYYSTIRPKRRARSGERQGLALRRGGVEYVEVRALDVSVFDLLGVNLDELRFLEAFLIHCLLDDSPLLHPGEQAAAERNQRRVSWEGRRPGLRLERDESTVALTDWAAEILDGVEAVAELLDATGDGLYARAVARQREALREPQMLPSARLLAEMRRGGESYFEYVSRMSQAHDEELRARAPVDASRAYLERVAEESLARQRDLEASDAQSFDEYLAAYFNGTMALP